MGLKAVAVLPVINPPVPGGGGVIPVPSQSGITLVLVNSNLGTTTVNLPASPATNQWVIVQDSGMDAATNLITVQGNGHNINVPSLGVETSYPIGSNGSDSWFNWNGSAWGVLA